MGRIPPNNIPPTVKQLCKQILWTEQQIQQRLQEIAQEIYNYYTKRKEPVYHIHSIMVLTGAAKVAKDLLEYIQDINEKNPDKPPLVFHEDSEMYSSYGTEFTSGGRDIKLIVPTQFSTHYKHVLIIEDVIDTARTMHYLIYLKQHPTKNPQDIKIFSLIDKPHKRSYAYKNIVPDFVGFVLMEDEFLVGYGLDYQHIYRNLRRIIAIKDEFKKKKLK